MLCFPSNGDPKQLTKNPRHFSMPNPQANMRKKIFAILLERRQSSVLLFGVFLHPVVVVISLLFWGRLQRGAEKGGYLRCM